jgi:hypothetical protein
MAKTVTPTINVPMTEDDLFFAKAVVSERLNNAVVASQQSLGLGQAADKMVNDIVEQYKSLEACLDRAIKRL